MCRILGVGRSSIRRCIVCLRSPAWYRGKPAEIRYLPFIFYFIREIFELVFKESGYHHDPEPDDWPTRSRWIHIDSFHRSFCNPIMSRNTFSDHRSANLTSLFNDSIQFEKNQFSWQKVGQTRRVTWWWCHHRESIHNQTFFEPCQLAFK